MGKPKKQTSPRKTGLRRSHLVVKLARMVNAKSPVKAYTTKRESGKKKVADAEVKPAAKKTAAAKK
jgi:hypothetical protein